MKTRLLVLLVAVLGLAAPGWAGSLSDGFDGTAVDTSKWSIDGTSVVEAGGKVTMTVSASDPTREAGLTAEYQLRGPFDYQVDYALLEWPTDKYAAVGLLAILPDTTWTDWSVQRASIGPGSPFEQVYLADYVPPPGDTDTTYGITPTADTAGTLRIARDANSVLTASVRAAGASDWTVIYSAPMTPADVRPNLLCWTGGATPITVAFDNFQMNAGQVAAPGTFYDVPADYWAHSQISAVTKAGIATGYPDGSYRPAAPVTRDQMAVYVSRAVAGGDANVPTGPSLATFTDVPVDYWAFKYVEYAKELGIVTGYSATTYGPAVPVDRGQMAIFIARAIANPTGDGGLAGYTPPATPSFSDVGTDFYAYKYIEYVKSKGIVSGYPDGTYQPAVVVTRDQMAVYVARAFGLS